MFFWGVDETTFNQYMIVGPMQKEAVRSSKLMILFPFEIDDGNSQQKIEDFFTNLFAIHISTKTMFNQ